MTAEASGKTLKTCLSVKLNVLTFATSLVIVLNKKPNDMFTDSRGELTVTTRTYESSECH